MGQDYTPKKTLMDSNQFIITCPVFNSKTKIAACFTLREHVWRGNKPEVRKGCQMCMRFGKCPVNNIIWDMIRTPGLDPYHSDVPREGRLQEKHIAQIERVVIPERDLERAIERGDISPVEAKLMKASNAAARQTAAKGVRSAQEIQLVDVKIDRSVKAPAKTEDEVDPSILAATSGDMAAAVNQAMKERGNA